MNTGMSGVFEHVTRFECSITTGTTYLGIRAFIRGLAGVRNKCNFLNGIIGLHPESQRIGLSDLLSDIK